MAETSIGMQIFLCSSQMSKSTHFWMRSGSFYAKLMLYSQFCTTAFPAWVQKRKSHSLEKRCVNHSNSSHLYQEYQVEGWKASKISPDKLEDTFGAEENWPDWRRILIIFVLLSAA